MADLEKTLSAHPTLVVSKNNCPFCIAAMKLFKSKGVEPHEIKIESLEDNEANSLIEAVRNKYNHMTFPIIFVDGKFVGGYDNLKKYYQK